jgi:hypothetical protein
LILLFVAVAACSSDEDSEKAAAPNIGNYETCEGFINSNIVENQTGVSGLVDRVRVIDVNSNSIRGLADTGATANCLVEVFRTVDGDDEPSPGESVTLSIVQFETNEQARLLYNSSLAAAIVGVEQVGEIAMIQQQVVGNDSYLMNIDASGIGAIVVYVHDSVFISMSSATNAEGRALLDEQSLVNAAQSVQSRLP